ncbi:protein kinase domain-containing protein [Haliangium ochraceum]|uniref:Serine/threonine protein kinase n=1 Tax=Haliangium ochraceum (strain DSM 14365 / JCM 11303 / SMP-2) TaxID=502025 RepID=D0LVZ6_HALO1|nr:protein kinase [Haliangium ochraceum]ACY14130.1 serine/threonine protein kinase [Haliangium ochraceum DSM 14365]
MFGQYRVVERLAAGGMGEVYTATHDLMNREAVVKILLPEMLADASIVKRFFNEAQAAASIHHPGIVAVFDVGYAADGRAYIVMEKLRGESLQDRLDRVGRLEPAHAVTLVRQLAGAVGAAHERGIIHRDLKPANTFIVPDPEVPGGERMKVLDFGLAKLAAGRSASLATRAGSVFGTPAYMAPEQCNDAASVNQRADLYAIGCILFACVCGQPPFSGNPLHVMHCHVHQPPPAPRSLQPALPPYFEGVIRNLLQKRPSDRLASCAALIEALDQGAVLFSDNEAKHSADAVGFANTAYAAGSQAGHAGTAAPAQGSGPGYGPTGYAAGSQAGHAAGSQASQPQASQPQSSGSGISSNRPIASGAGGAAVANSVPGASWSASSGNAGAEASANPPGAMQTQKTAPSRSRLPLILGVLAIVVIAGLSAALWFVTQGSDDATGELAASSSAGTDTAAGTGGDGQAPGSGEGRSGGDSAALAAAGSASGARNALAVLPRDASVVARIDIARVLSSPLYESLLAPMLATEMEGDVGDALRSCSQGRHAARSFTLAVVDEDDVVVAIEGLTRESLGTCLRRLASSVDESVKVRQHGRLTEADDGDETMWFGWIDDTTAVTRRGPDARAAVESLLAGSNGVDGDARTMALIDQVDEDAAFWLVAAQAERLTDDVSFESLYVSLDLSQGMGLTLGVRHDDQRDAQDTAAAVHEQLGELQSSSYSELARASQVDVRGVDVVVTMRVGLETLQEFIGGEGGEELLEAMVDSF